MQLAIFESKRMHEESQLFDLELNFNSKFKSKLMSLNSEIINIEQNYQSKLDFFNHEIFSTTKYTKKIEVAYN